MDLKFVPPINQIYKVKSPNWPELHFEWHELSKKVYWVKLSDPEPRTANLLAFNIPDHGSAVNAVAIWLRGYSEGMKSPPIIGTKE